MTGIPGMLHWCSMMVIGHYLKGRTRGLPEPNGLNFQIFNVFLSNLNYLGKVAITMLYKANCCNQWQQRVECLKVINKKDYDWCLVNKPVMYGTNFLQITAINFCRSGWNWASNADKHSVQTIFRFLPVAIISRAPETWEWEITPRWKSAYNSKVNELKELNWV